MIDTVFWIKVPAPTLDIAGLVLGSLALVGLLAGLSITLGALLSAGLIARHRHDPPARPALHHLLAGRGNSPTR